MPQIDKSQIRNLLLEQIPDAVVGLNDKYEVIDYNLESLTFFNLSAEEMKSASVLDLLPQGIPKNNGQRFEAEAFKKNHGPLSVEVTSVRVEAQEESYRYLVFRNITLRKKITRELQLFTDTVENSLNAFDIVDAQGNFAYVNKAYVKMWGYDSAEEILGTSAAGHCKDSETPLKIITALKETGECNIEFLGLKKDGSTFNVLMWARLAHDPDGNEIYPTTSIDISHRVTAEKENAKLREELEMAVKARDEFISICSHELKTPITSLKLQFQLAEKQLKNKNPDVLTEENVKRRISLTNKQLDRMAALIEDMLDVSKISSGNLALNLENISFHELIQEVMERLKDSFVSLKIPVHINIHSKECVVSCDRFRMEQVIQNLLTNAIKYGSGEAINLDLSCDNEKVILLVQDKGIGIDSKIIDKIFDRYERAVHSTDISGLGLGLYISRQIVELHHGHISVTSTLGKGSTFKVELPRIKINA